MYYDKFLIHNKINLNEIIILIDNKNYKLDNIKNYKYDNNYANKMYYS